ncbi:DUF2259 domain-containing protein [Martelella soudanensis]|uniref:DUF2259 domain-containing protein n=1 Tax=unclassified Martelella TaxID=2629616 RepID=UPI0015DD85E1|nr:MULTISPECIES: DUF2259 domain-containing protein [unclassified Martelella]
MAGLSRFLGAAVASGLTAATASAGDFATFTPLGFSEDGKVFAFEEYGQEDGSGFAYSNIFFIDTENDVFLDGTPFRLRSETDNASISAARAMAVREALQMIQDRRLLDHPGWLAAFNPVTENSSDGDTIRYRAHPNLSPVSEISIETFPLSPNRACAAITPDARGFRLTYRGPEGGELEVHEDERLPESRNCPLDYRLGGVMTYGGGGPDAVHVALVTVLSQGFEGPNGRWIAVPFRP